MASFSERMTELRVEKGLNKAEVARGTGLSRSAITSYENGSRDNPTNDILKRLAEFFDVSLDYLTGQSNIKDKLTARRQDIVDGYINNNPKTFGTVTKQWNAGNLFFAESDKGEFTIAFEGLDVTRIFVENKAGQMLVLYEK